MIPSVAIEYRELEQGSSLRSVRPATKRRRMQIHLSFTYSWPRAIGVVLLLSVACVFYICPVHYLSDGGFSLLMDEAIIHEWTPDMSTYKVPRGHGRIYINGG